MDKKDINNLSPLTGKFPMIITLSEKDEKKLEKFKEEWVKFMKIQGKVRVISNVNVETVVTEKLIDLSKADNFLQEIKIKLREIKLENSKDIEFEVLFEAMRDIEAKAFHLVENIKRETNILQEFLEEAVRLSDRLRDLKNE